MNNKLLNKIPVPNLSAALEALNNLVDAAKQCYITSEIEQTKRENIRAFREINVKAIEENSAILKSYLQRIFEERAFTIQNMFIRLDQSLASGNSQAASEAIFAIVSVTKESPLAGVRELISNINDPNVKTIEI